MTKNNKQKRFAQTLLFQKSGAGFSLIGVIVAVFVVSIGLIAILDLSQTSLKAASFSKSRLIASGLAQEGIEVVRYIRQTHSDWDDWYSAVSSGDYLVQYDSANLLVFSETPLDFDIDSGLYQYGFGNESSFYRKIALTKMPSGDEVKVIVEIKWWKSGNWHNLTVEDRLWNWK